MSPRYELPAEEAALACTPECRSDGKNDDMLLRILLVANLRYPTYGARKLRDVINEQYGWQHGTLVIGGLRRPEVGLTFLLLRRLPAHSNAPRDPQGVSGLGVLRGRVVSGRDARRSKRFG